MSEPTQIPLQVSYPRKNIPFIIDGLEWELEYYFGCDIDFVGDHSLHFGFRPVFNTTREDVKRRVIWNITFTEDAFYDICKNSYNLIETYTRKSSHPLYRVFFKLKVTELSKNANFVLGINMKIEEMDDDDIFGAEVKG